MISLNVQPYNHYSFDQIEKHEKITVGELRERLEAFDDDEEIVLYNPNNTYGPQWGNLNTYEVFTKIDEEGNALEEW